MNRSPILNYPNFLCRINTRASKEINLMIEVTGFNKDKSEKKWFTENRWLPAVNFAAHLYGWEEWHFIEIANDIRDIKNQITAKIQGISNG